MKKYFILLLLPLICVSCGPGSKKISFLTVPEVRDEYVETADIKAYQDKYAGHDGVYLDILQNIEHFGKKSNALAKSLFGGFTPRQWTYNRIVKRRFMVLNPEARWLTTFEIPFKPDVMYLPDYYNKVSLIAKQAKERGINVPLVGGDGWDSPDLDLEAVDGGYYTNHYSPEDPRPHPTGSLPSTTR